MIKKIVIVPFVLGLLLMFFSFGIPKSNAMNTNNMPMSKSVMMKMKRWMPDMMHFAPKLTFMPFFYKVYPGAHLIFNARKMLKLTPSQIKQEAMLVKEMENKAIPQFKILNRTKKEFYMEVGKNNPNPVTLMQYEKTAENAEMALSEAMISVHVKATRVLTPSQKMLLRKMMINWPQSK